MRVLNVSRFSRETYSLWILSQTDEGHVWWTAEGAEWHNTSLPSNNSKNSSGSSSSNTARPISKVKAGDTVDIDTQLWIRANYGNDPEWAEEKFWDRAKSPLVDYAMIQKVSATRYC